MSSRRYKITKSQLQYYLHCKRTVDDISEMTKVCKGSIRNYIKKYSLEEYHECKYCHTDNFHSLKSQMQAGKFVIFNVCENCYNLLLSSQIKKAYSVKGKDIVEKRHLTNIDKYGVPCGFNKPGVRIAINTRRIEKCLERKLSKKGKKKPLSHERYRNKAIFYEEYIIKNKTLYELKVLWKCKPGILLKYLRIHGFEEKYRCASCGSISNLVKRKGRNTFKYKEFCRVCIGKKDSNAVKKYNHNKLLDIIKNKSITKDRLLQLHKNNKLSLKEISNYFEIPLSTLKNIFYIFNLQEIKRCNYCKSEEDLFPRKGKDTNVCTSCRLQRSSKQSGYSKVSQRLFWEIYNLLPKELQNNTRFEELNGEFFHKIPNHMRDALEIPNKAFRYDFCIYHNETMLIIEFNGDTYHANPKLYKEDDRPNPKNRRITAKEIWRNDLIREEYNFAMGAMHLIIWEKDYHTNKQDTIDNIIMNINMVYYSNENKNLRSFLDAE